MKLMAEEKWECIERTKTWNDRELFERIKKILLLLLGSFTIFISSTSFCAPDEKCLEFIQPSTIPRHQKISIYLTFLRKCSSINAKIVFYFLFLKARVLLHDLMRNEYKYIFDWIIKLEYELKLWSENKNICLPLIFIRRGEKIYSLNLNIQFSLHALFITSTEYLNGN